MKQKNNNLTPEKNVNEIITNDTPPTLNEKEWRDIGKGGKRWERICPKCKRVIFHNTKYQRNYALDKPCKNCSHIGLVYKKRPTDQPTNRPTDQSQLVRRCPECEREIKYNRIDSKKRAEKQNRVCMHCVGNIAIKYRKPFSYDTLSKMSNYRKGKHIQNWVLVVI